jgi:hypothetical protein
MREGGGDLCVSVVILFESSMEKNSFRILFVLLVFLLVFEVDLGACSYLDIFLLRSFVLVSDLRSASFLIPV